HLELEKWRVFRSPRFILFSNAPAADAERLTWRLTAFAEVVSRVARLEQSNSLPTNVVIFRTYEQFMSFARAVIAGFMAADLEENLLVASAQGAESVPVLFHEYTHLLLHGDLALPAWFHEGFAELLSTTTLREGLATLTGVPSYRVRTLMHGSRVPVEQ